MGSGPLTTVASISAALKNHPTSPSPSLVEQKAQKDPWGLTAPPRRDTNGKNGQVCSVERYGTVYMTVSPGHRVPDTDSRGSPSGVGSLARSARQPRVGTARIAGEKTGPRWPAAGAHSVRADDYHPCRGLRGDEPTQTLSLIHISEPTRPY